MDTLQKWAAFHRKESDKCVAAVIKAFKRDTEKNDALFKTESNDAAEDEPEPVPLEKSVSSSVMIWRSL